MDPNARRALEALAARPEWFARRGTVVAGFRQYQGQRHGPYYRLTWREEGRQCSLYLGREGPGVARVQAELARLQRPRVEETSCRRLEREARRGLRECQRELAALSAQFGLRMHGGEIRGFRALARTDREAGPGRETGFPA